MSKYIVGLAGSREKLRTLERAEINEIETKKTIVKINKTKSWL